jgi:hypothetical protein
MRSLLAPLVTGLLLSLAVVFLAQWSVIRVAVDAVMKDYVAGELAHDADELFSALSIIQGGEASLALGHFDPPFLRPHSGHYYQILVGRTTALRSPSLVDDRNHETLDRGGAVSITFPAGPGVAVDATGYSFRSPHHDRRCVRLEAIMRSSSD